jgi:hypothetical protein
MAKTHPASFRRDPDHDRDTEKADKNDHTRDDPGTTKTKPSLQVPGQLSWPGTSA